LATQDTSPVARIVPDPVPPFDPPDLVSFSENKLLAGISREIYAQIAKNIDIVRCIPNEIIFQENEPGDSLYLIAQGSVKISKSGRAGQQETLTYLMERDFFGEMALVDNELRSAQAAAVGNTVLGRIDRQGWNSLLRFAPQEVLSNLTKSTTKRLRDSNLHFIAEVMPTDRLSLIGTIVRSIADDTSNPIACILGACDVIRGTSQDELTGKMISLVREAAEKIEIMMRELVDFSRGDTQLNIQSIRVGEFLHDLEPDFAACRPLIGVEMEALYDGPMKVDRLRLLRVFGTLIRNAREAMANSSVKALRFSVRRIDSYLHFEVADTGCGIDLQLLPRIFEPFLTKGKSTRTGLGLAISKAVVEAHHGLISVKSSERGTTFMVELPLDLERFNRVEDRS